MRVSPLKFTINHYRILHFFFRRQITRLIKSLWGFYIRIILAKPVLSSKWREIGPSIRGHKIEMSKEHQQSQDKLTVYGFFSSQLI